MVAAFAAFLGKAAWGKGLASAERRLANTPRRAPAMQAGVFSVAPMLDVTNGHFRTMARMISRHATLYTEMVVDQALVHNPDFADRSLRLVPHPEFQDPVVLQLGGSDPAVMEAACRVVRNYWPAGGFGELNLNCGCPSDRVSGAGCFGAVLMRSPDKVAELCARMSAAADRPVSVKCRIGLNNEDSYPKLCHFVETVSTRGGVSHFIIHARTAVLGGLTPKQNRTVPPLRYHYVYDLKRDFPHLSFTLNGGVQSLSDVRHHLSHGVDGVMLGRAVMDRPWAVLADVDFPLYGSRVSTTRRRVLEQYAEYAERELTDGATVHALARPILNLFAGEARQRAYKRVLMDRLVGGDDMSVALEEALAELDEQVVDKESASAADEDRLDGRGESGNEHAPQLSHVVRVNAT